MFLRIPTVVIQYHLKEYFPDYLPVESLSVYLYKQWIALTMNDNDDIIHYDCDIVSIFNRISLLYTELESTENTLRTVARNTNKVPVTPPLFSYGGIGHKLLDDRHLICHNSLVNSGIYKSDLSRINIKKLKRLKTQCDFLQKHAKRIVNLEEYILC